MQSILLPAYIHCLAGSNDSCRQSHRLRRQAQSADRRHYRKCRCTQKWSWIWANHRTLDESSHTHVCEQRGRCQLDAQRLCSQSVCYIHSMSEFINKHDLLGIYLSEDDWVLVAVARWDIFVAMDVLMTIDDDPSVVRLHSCECCIEPYKEIIVIWLNESHVVGKFIVVDSDDKKIAETSRVEVTLRDGVARVPHESLEVGELIPILVVTSYCLIKGMLAEGRRGEECYNVWDVRIGELPSFEKVRSSVSIIVFHVVSVVSASEYTNVSTSVIWDLNELISKSFSRQSSAIQVCPWYACCRDRTCVHYTSVNRWE